MVIVSAVAVCLLAYVATTLDLQAMAAGLLQRLPPETVLAGMLRWQSLELGCWGAAALLLAFFTWLLYAALFDTVGMVAGVAPAVAAAICVFVVRGTPFLCDDLRGGGASQVIGRASPSLSTLLLRSSSSFRKWQCRILKSGKRWQSSFE
jgi:peptidoglycan/LPS O-acetylase OafA/YrhL